jgi:hypothetical protein
MPHHVALSPLSEHGVRPTTFKEEREMNEFVNKCHEVVWTWDEPGHVILGGVLAPQPRGLEPRFKCVVPTEDVGREGDVTDDPENTFYQGGCLFLVRPTQERPPAAPARAFFTLAGAAGSHETLHLPKGRFLAAGLTNVLDSAVRMCR